MFAAELDHGSIKQLYITCILKGGFAFEMDNGGICDIIIDKSLLFNTIAKIDVLSIHEKAFVKSAGTVQDGPGYAHTGA
jgi:hypothetical protein